MAAVVQNQMGHVARATIFSTLLMILLCSTACKSLNFGPFNLMTKSQKPNKLSRIVELVAASNYGLNSSLNVEIISLINDLKVSQPLPLSDSSQVDGFWELLWTTEKETLFFKKNGLFGKDCTVISQSINTRAAVINNLIEFEDGRRFIVDGKISIDAAKPNRVNFQFSGACITIPPLNIPLPPVGKGWFDTIYVDKEYRVSYDVRGDYLISRRMSPTK